VLPAAVLCDPLQARQRVNLIVTRLSKQVERAHLEEAGRGSQGGGRAAASPARWWLTARRLC